MRQLTRRRGTRSKAASQPVGDLIEFRRGQTAIQTEHLDVKHRAIARIPNSLARGNNTYLRRVPGFSAKPGYDLASGLGVPQFAALATAVPAAGS